MLLLLIIFAIILLLQRRRIADFIWSIRIQDGLNRQDRWDRHGR